MLLSLKRHPSDPSPSTTAALALSGHPKPGRESAIL
jgi:hypothetical protein